MSTSSSPAFSHLAIVDEALSRSAKISKVILDISRNVEPDSHLDALWQRLHSGELSHDIVGLDNPEPLEDAPKCELSRISTLSKSLVSVSPINSRTMLVDQLKSFLVVSSWPSCRVLPDLNKGEIGKLLLITPTPIKYTKDLKTNKLAPIVFRQMSNQSTIQAQHWRIFLSRRPYWKDREHTVDQSCFGRTLSSTESTVRKLFRCQCAMLWIKCLCCVTWMPWPCAHAWYHLNYSVWDCRSATFPSFRATANLNFGCRFPRKYPTQSKMLHKLCTQTAIPRMAIGDI